MLLRLAALCLILSSTPAQAFPYQQPFRFTGPLGVTQEHPLRQALLDVPLVGPLDRPVLRLARTAANVWNSHTHLATRDGDVVHAADLQQEGLVLDAAVPLGHFLAVGGRVGVARIWGGGPVDTIIEDFHGAFEFYNFDREYAPQGRTVMTVKGPHGPVLDWNSPRTILQSPLLSVFARLLESPTTRVMMRADAQLPLGDVARALQLWAPELGVGMSVATRLYGILSVHLAANALWHGNRVVGGLTVNPIQWMAEASVELRLLPFLTFLIEDRLQSPLFTRNAVLQEDLSLERRATAWNAYFTPVNLISFGPRLYLPLGATLTVYAMEDFMLCTECWEQRLSRETNAPDVAGVAVLQQSLPSLAF